MDTRMRSPPELGNLRLGRRVLVGQEPSIPSVRSYCPAELTLLANQFTRPIERRTHGDTDVADEAMLMRRFDSVALSSEMGCIQCFCDGA
jgi:hypothetical protein